MIPSFLVDQLHKLPDLGCVVFALEPAQGHWLNNWQFIYTVSWDTELNLASMGFNLLLKERTWELTYQKVSHLGKRDLLGQWETIVETKDDWRWGSWKVLLLLRSWVSYVEAATQLDAHPSQKPLLLFWLDGFKRIGIWQIAHLLFISITELWYWPVNICNCFSLL